MSGIKKSDLLPTIHEAQYALEEGGRCLSEAFQYFHDGMLKVQWMVDAGSDDIWCNALVSLFPLVEQAVKIEEGLPKLPARPRPFAVENAS
jgi:hypothetical protein